MPKQRCHYYVNKKKLKEIFIHPFHRINLFNQVLYMHD